ncbi:ferric iron reductase [Glycomyces buryatensis]|uniref:ferric iron reductase n=1 Tax=Glycomyces buryatensis TaxID=2570927 RepID=UPI001B3C1479|nr:ferric iron reductase [Glycomyces buryatensis]
MLSATAVDVRPDLTTPDPLAALRDAANRVGGTVGPNPLLGLRDWLDSAVDDTAEPDECVEFAATELTDGTRVAELLGAASALWGGSPHANAALAWKTYCYWMVAPAVLGYVTARRVPLMEAGNAVFRISEGEPMFAVRQPTPRFLALPDDPCAGLPGVEVVAGEAALLERMRASLLENHLAPVLAAFLREVRVGRRTMMGSLASGLAYATASCAQVVDEPAEVIAKNLLSAFDVADLVDVATDEEGRLVYQRRTCCLAITLEGARTCTTCCVGPQHR